MKRERTKNEYTYADQLTDAMNGKNIICSKCGKKESKVRFFFFPDDMGYAISECKSCGSAASFISRMKYNDRIKGEVVRL